MRLRKEPNGSIVTELSMNTVVEVLEKSATEDTVDGKTAPWYRVQTKDKREGWVFGQFLNLEEREEDPPQAKAKKAGSAADCAYYAVKNEVRCVCVPDMEPELVYAIPAEVKPNKTSDINAAAGKLLWRSGDKLYTWDGRNQQEIPLERFPDVYADGFLISPKGDQIAWNVNRIDSVAQTGGAATSLIHEVYAAALDGRGKRLVLREKFTVVGFSAEHGASRRLVHWSKESPNKLFLTTLKQGEGASDHKDFDALNLRTGSLSKKNKDAEKEYLSEAARFSPSGERVAVSLSGGKTFLLPTDSVPLGVRRDR